MAELGMETRLSINSNKTREFESSGFSDSFINNNSNNTNGIGSGRMNGSNYYNNCISHLGESGRGGNEMRSDDEIGTGSGSALLLSTLNNNYNNNTSPEKLQKDEYH